MVLGCALILLGWRHTAKSAGEAPVWSAMPTVIFCLTLTVILWMTLRDRERAFALSTMQTGHGSARHRAEGRPFPGGQPV